MAIRCCDCRKLKEDSEFPFDIVSGKRERRIRCYLCKRLRRDERRIRTPQGPSVWQLQQRDKYLQRKYGITLGQYRAMLAAQGGVCAICGQPETREFEGHVINLAVDHDHTTGQVRGLLCARCNTGLRFFRSDSGLFRRALEYIGNTNLP